MYRPLRRIYRKAYRVECYAMLALLHKDIALAKFFMQERNYLTKAVNQGY